MKRIHAFGYLVLLILCFCIFGQNVSLQKRLKNQDEFIKDNLESVYTLMKGDSSRLYTIMDTEIRILHYAKPHKEPMWCCPECEDIRKKATPNDKEVPSKVRSKQVQEGTIGSGT